MHLSMIASDAAVVGGFGNSVVGLGLHSVPRVNSRVYVS